MQFNSITANSNQDPNRTNAYSWIQRYPDFITRPKTVSLISASIPITYLSFPSSKLSMYMYVYGSVYKISIVNGYYDDVQEFLPMLNTATANAIGNTSFTWSFSNANQCLKLTCSGTTQFQIKSYLYANDSIVERLGFIDNKDYNSYLEGSNTVIYAEGVLQLARTTGFYIASSIVQSNNCASPTGAMGILDFIPITSAKAYGDTVAIHNSSLNTNVVTLTQSERFNASSQIVFQVLDDHFQLIDDIDRGGYCVLYLQMDYD